MNATLRAARGLCLLAVAAILLSCAGSDSESSQSLMSSISAGPQEPVDAQAASSEPASATTTTVTVNPPEPVPSVETETTTPITVAANPPSPSTLAVSAATTTTTDLTSSAQNTTQPAETKKPDNSDTVNNVRDSDSSATSIASTASDNAASPDVSASPDNAASPDVSASPDHDHDAETLDVDSPVGATVPDIVEELLSDDPPSPVVTVPPEANPYQQALVIASRLAPNFVLPNDCQPPPLDRPYAMPNAPRAYRSGVHRGVDFLCRTAGHPVVSVLDGQVVVAVGEWQDPTLAEWNEILAVGEVLGYTPAYTLAMVSGRYVTVDHGIIDGVGHVVTEYVHLDSVEPGIRAGTSVVAGQRLGGVGNSGTRAPYVSNPLDHLHLHWNFFINGEYLGAGLSVSETRQIYAELFKYADGTTPRPRLDEAGTVSGRGDSDSGSSAPYPSSVGHGTITFSGHKALGKPISPEHAVEAATTLSDVIVLPSDCLPVPLQRASRLPNAPRAYRSGTHQGVDFYCSGSERPALAALPGRVVAVVSDFEDPSPQQRNRLLATASTLGATPVYTLMMLYGNYIVVDHGIIDGVGHVVTLYAHLDSIDSSIRVGAPIVAGQKLGVIGNTGTPDGAAGDMTGLHLHWELHINGHYLGIGLPEADTQAVYSTLFTKINSG